MTPIAYHVTLRLDDGRVIAPSTAERRALAGVILRVCADLRLLTFRAADTHLHKLVACSRAEAGRLAQRIGASLRAALRIPVAFERARFKPVRDQRHLVNAFHYVLRQDERHDLPRDPFHEASNLPDLLGLRVLGAYTCRHVHELLPRVKREHLLELLGDDLERPIVDYAPLQDAAAAAFGLPALAGRSVHVTAARRAAVHAVGRALSTSALAAALGIAERTVKRLRTEPAEARHVGAVDLQLRLRQAVAAPQGEAALQGVGLDVGVHARRAPAGAGRR